MKIELKKQKKKAALMQAAYTLVLRQGMENSSVGDITTAAGVAKGTFYLYFRDKQDIVTAVIVVLSRQILEEAYLKMCAVRTGDFAEDMTLLANALLDFLADNKPLLGFIERGFRWPAFRERMNATGNPVWQSLRNDLRLQAERTGKDEEELIRRVYCLVSMCGSVAYSSIMRGEPEDLSRLRPVICGIIRDSLRAEAAE